VSVSGRLWEVPIGRLRAQCRPSSSAKRRHTSVGVSLFVSLVLAAGSTMLGELWIWTAEAFRIGNEHKSYRGNRLFWAGHRFELFAIALMIFWLAAIKAAHRLRLERPSGR
jgi:hypothetical protein